jgi:hypothetical protein
VDGGSSGWLSSGLTADQYIAELAAFAAELDKDPYVLYAAVFTAGPTPDWQAFSTDSLDMSRFYKDVPMAPPGSTLEDQRYQQEEQQFSHEAEALYAVIKMLDKANPGNPDLQTAKTELNALNPQHFTF